MTRLASEYNTRHCGGYFCPYHFWRASVMLSVAHWDWKRPDWLTAGPAVCSHWQLYLLHLCSIILSAEVHPELCQQTQYSTPPTVIRLLHWESPDLIRKGTWPLTTTPSPLLLSFRLLSSPLASSCLLLWTPQWHLNNAIPVPFPPGQELPRLTLPQ